MATIVLFLFVANTSAQTLTEKLLQENPQSLAAQARKNGDIVRGAILFHQGNINCAKCHRSSSEKDRIGPDLRRLEEKEKVSDAALIESILEPSKSINEDFRTFTALKLDGSSISGLIVKQDAKQVSVRNRKNIDQVVTIPREEIDELGPDKISSMPDNLADELKNRQQFLDLLRYVIELKERGPGTDLVTEATTARRLSEKHQGLIAIQNRNCAACHELTLANAPIQPKQAPRLSRSLGSLNPAYVADFIRDPEAIKPGTTMPGSLHMLKHPEQEKVAEALTHFLKSKTGNEYQAPKIDASSAARGFQVFHAVGCVACHSPRDQLGNEKPLASSVPLGDISRKYSHPGLTKFLQDPLLSRPSGHMPQLKLSFREASELSHFLLQSKSQPQSTWKVDAELAKLGEEYFTKYNCASCHDDVLGKAIPNQRTRLDPSRLSQGCLSGKDTQAPRFQLTDAERGSIQKFVATPLEWKNLDRIDVTLEFLRCTNCHERSKLGGVDPARNPHFQTTNLNLGDQGRIPPSLTGVGAKLKPQWMRDVLVNGRTIRPYMKTRMPQYGENNVAQLVEQFQASDKLEQPVEFAQFEDQKAMRETGLKLAGNQGLNCVACHTYKFKQSDTMPAVDLTEMTDRLKKDWFYEYMLAPQSFSPNTVMPSFWPAGKPIRKDLQGSPRDQIEALWQYLVDGRQARMPRGVIRERLEIVVDQEAQMLRRSYPGIGKRGIGVGYPGGINIAFDAEQMRLGLIWKGKFADPGGVWTGQGSGNVRPMGKTYSFPKGPDLDDRDQPWSVDDGRPPKHRFLGYRLDSKCAHVPVRVGATEVSDCFREVQDKQSDQVVLSRKLKLRTGKEARPLVFRIAEGKKFAVKRRPTVLGRRPASIRISSTKLTPRIATEDGKKRLEFCLAGGRPGIGDYLFLATVDSVPSLPVCKSPQKNCSDMDEWRMANGTRLTGQGYCQVRMIRKSFC